jgi:hypothetical protein
LLKISTNTYISRENGCRELGLIEKNKVEFLALEQLGYREIRNREYGMTPEEPLLDYFGLLEYSYL